MAKLVCLLRGINVGGNKTIRMEALTALFEELGFSSVRTHLNSGNVVFASDNGRLATLSELIGEAIAEKFGFRPAIMLRTSAALRKILDRNPFPEEARSDPSHLLVMFLAGKPNGAMAARLAGAHAGPERIKVSGDTVYLTYPNGIGRSRLTNELLEKHLGLAGTARNWNTVVKLSEIAEAS